MNRETRTRWYNHKCSKCSAHPFVIIIRIVLYALVRYLRPTLYYCLGYHVCVCYEKLLGAIFKNPSVTINQEIVLLSPIEVKHNLAVNARRFSF